jgi:death-on-curing protein
MHVDQIERYGGSHGVRDPGQLEAAVYRPQTGYYADIIEEAAALWESLAQNHPFVDGNKRTAFAATYTFLAVNGLRVIADSKAAYAFISGLYGRNQFRFDELVPWLKRHTTPASHASKGFPRAGSKASDQTLQDQRVRHRPEPAASTETKSHPESTSTR